MTRLFISYSHDSDAHRDFVRGLSDRLRADGLDCQIDQYINGFPPEGWQRWMETQVEAADFVLLVCTPDYLKRFRGLETDGGRGVNFEGVVISQTLYDEYYRNTKFVPVIPEDGELADVPLPLKGFSVFRVMAEYEGVYRFLTGQAAVVAPDVGERVVLPESSPSPLSRESGKHPHPNPSPSEGEGLTVVSTTPCFAEPDEPSGRRKEKRVMSDTMKAAWIGGVFVLIGAIIAGVFALFTATNITVSGSECAGVITGEVSGTLNQTCGESDESK